MGEPAPPTGVLIVDDDVAISEVIAQVLGPRYETRMALSGDEAMKAVRLNCPELILLDLTLPDVDGLVLLSQMRLFLTTPVIVLSGRCRQVDVVVSLRQGADDFIRKPFDIYDLEARVEIVLKRARRERIVPPGRRTEVVYGAMVISDARGICIGDVPVHLTPSEYRVFRRLAEEQGERVSRSELAQFLWGLDLDAQNSHTLDIYVSRIRKRLVGVPDAPTIETSRGRSRLGGGFRLT